MPKKQIEKAFDQLKKSDRIQNIQFPQFISLLTNNKFTEDMVRNFITDLQDNQEVESLKVKSLINHASCKQIEFQMIYFILKHLKSYLKRRNNYAQIKLGTQSNRNQLHISDISKIVDRTISRSSVLLNLVDELKKKKQENTFVGEKPHNYQEKISKQLEQKCLRYEQKVIRKLLIIFDYFRKNMHAIGQSFEKNKKLSEFIDINVFAKYFKSFQLSDIFSYKQTTKHFKNYAINSLWLNFDLFVNLHWQIISYKSQLPVTVRYLHIKSLNQLLAAQKIQKLLNLKSKRVVTQIQNDNGVYRMDLLKKINQNDANQQSLQKVDKTRKKGKSQPIFKLNRFMQNKAKQFERKSNQDSKLERMSNNRVPRVKTENQIENFEIKNMRQKRNREMSFNPSIYKSLNLLKLSKEELKIKELINPNEKQQYLEHYLNIYHKDKKLSKNNR